MTPEQQRKLQQLEDELKLPHGTLPIRGERKGYVFTEVNGVTVLLALRSRNPNGGFIVPSLHTYTETVTPTNLHAAANARNLYDSQTRKLGGERYKYKFGHRGPIVSTEWKCKEQCPCRDGDGEPEERREERSIGHPIKS
jgi:hypothetical protein